MFQEIGQKKLFRQATMVANNILHHQQKILDQLLVYVNLQEKANL